MTDYEIKGIQLIRNHGGRLDNKTDDELVRLYRDWSEETASAGWLTSSEQGIKCFYEWATTAPCDRGI